MNTLQPESIFSFFHEICQIPRESGNERGMTEYLQAFADRRGLECRTDGAGNVVIRKPASSGKENAPVIVLQSHTDMVCEKNEDVFFDFSKDAINYYVEDGWMKARGTTLGADDGIGVAAQLAVLNDLTLVHGPIECLFTVSEETGLDGARALAPGFITGEILLNLDSEDEGEVFIGCAGGIDTTARFQYAQVPLPSGTTTVKVAVSGGTGGHSGDEIHKDLCNAVQVLARFLWNARKKIGFDIASINGGNKRNAIAREAFALCVVPNGDMELFRSLFIQYSDEVSGEYRITDPFLRTEITPAGSPSGMIDRHTADRIVAALYSCPHGALSMSKEIPGLVETSTNLASVKMDIDGEIRVGTSQRSAIDSARRNAAMRIESLFALAGALVTHESEYPGWAPNSHSPILRVCKEAYEKLFNTEVKVRAIHAGLECGLFLNAFPHLDMISFGPTLKGVHSPGECLEISTVQKFWLLLLEILKTV